jgi:DNA-binding NarL/FixJ family response regulator
MKVTIGLADDHQLFTQSLVSLLTNELKHYEVVAQEAGGWQLLERLKTLLKKPDIIMLDVRMPQSDPNVPRMDGPQTAKEIHRLYPEIKIVALTSMDDDASIINMIRAGCTAYFLKDIHVDELDRALMEISSKGFYNGDSINIRYRRLLRHADTDEIKLNDREIQFLKLACSDLTYKQVAAEMNLAERTIDGYREAMFEKLNVQSRVGMAIEAIRRQLISI